MLLILRTRGQRLGLSKLANLASAQRGSAALLCGKAPPFRLKSKNYSIRAAWKAMPSKRRG